MEQKRILSFMICIMLFFGLNGCIKEEALNTEADIEQASILNGDLALSTAPSIGNNTIIFKLKRFSGSYVHTPEFVLTPGATILPKSGTELDFSQPQKYTVTSQDGAWSKTYTVSFVVDEGANFYGAFENAQVVDTDNPVGHYHQFFELTADGQKNIIWETANEGYNILAGTLVGEDKDLIPSFYPTSQVTDGYLGNAAKLMTKDTGPLGGMFGSPLAAGNLFVGEFRLTFPTVNSTRFGISYNNDTAPVALKGFFKYKAGEKFVDNTKPSQLTKDTWDGYAILFEKSADLNKNFLTGTHAFKDSRIVSVARIGTKEQIETDKWTAFNVPFSFVNGKSFDPAKEYMYTIVFSSSKEGDIFNGAVGSTLFIDEVELVTGQKK
ncbi:MULTISPECIES: PCMD domain-containing protein [Sphingobacterium]|uniref:PCMD domain-containing protein n=1 Tax=Sphingobacterium kitahiroshimense TaxID=470446 RepID=A0ABV0BPX2_9SPHI|nr:PCMD domain-containing protein [Sphingobacterium sp. JUb56]MBB2953952.1 hypothetical protein [Sphingobacterium sp. JUb56]